MAEPTDDWSALREVALRSIAEMGFYGQTAGELAARLGARNVRVSAEQARALVADLAERGELARRAVPQDWPQQRGGEDVWVCRS